MSRRRSSALGAVVLLLATLAACGIPDETDVRVDGQGPVADTALADRNGVQPPSRTESGSDPEKFVTNFLSAAAGEAGEAYKRVNQFIMPTERFNPKQDDKGDINVVRVERDIVITPNGDGTSLVTVVVQQIGVLRANGSIDKPVATDTSYSFTIGAARTDPGSDDGLWVLDPPSALLMTDEALDSYYQAHTIYFWNANQDALVPDLRYLPRTVPVERHATEVLDWLIGGPAEWLSSVAVGLPDDTSSVGNVPAPKQGGRLEVNIKAGALETVELEKLFTQLVWSLSSNPLLDNELELKIQNQSKKIAVVADYRRDHPLYQLSGAPTRFGVFAGRIYPLGRPGEPAPVQIPISSEANQDIVTAGTSRDGDDVAVALVCRDGDFFRLRTGSGPGVASVLHLGAERYSKLGRPVWLKEAGAGGPVGLVVADGELMTFSVGNPEPTPVTLPGVSGPVTAVGAAVDGNRIAFVAGGRLYVAAVGPENGKLKVGTARLLATSLSEPSAVDWFGENLIVVAGRDEGGTAINRINVDGTLESQQVRNVGSTVTGMAAYPSDLAGQPFPAVSSPLMYEANQVAYMSETPISPSQVPAGADAPPANKAAAAAFYLY